MPSPSITPTAPAEIWERFHAVSRSFSPVVAQLPQPLADQVMIGYCLCRLADTIEDIPLPEEARRREFERLRHALVCGGDFRPDAALRDHASEADRALLDRANAVLEAWRGPLFTQAQRRRLAECVREMIDGMSGWDFRRMAGAEALDRYCHHVAGVVGLWLCDLFADHGIWEAPTHAYCRERAEAFGAALQLVNILKDLRDDARAGRCFWPSSWLDAQGISPEHWPDRLPPEAAGRALGPFLDHWRIQAVSALEYLAALPRVTPAQRQVGFFCALPLAMAVETVRLAVERPALVFEGPKLKLARAETEALAARCLASGGDVARWLATRWP